MKVLIALVAVCAVALAAPRPGNSAVMNGLLCLPCIQLVTNGENNAEGDVGTWLNKEIQAVCEPLGFFKKECIAEFTQYEKQLTNDINNDVNPRTSCTAIDFCDPQASSAPAPK